jgi:electron transfer flavoprotein alpha subunit
MANIGIYIELKKGKIKKSNFEAIGLAGRSGMNVTGIIFTDDLTPYKESLKGLSTLIQISAVDLTYQPDYYANTISEIVKEFDLKYLIGTFSAQGRELFPRVCAKLENAGLVNDCIEVDFSKDTVTKPVYAGKLLCKYKLKSEVKIFTLRPNIFTPAEDGEVNFTVSKFDLKKDVLKTNIIETIKSESAKIDLTEAEVIVSGGRGLKSKENFSILSDLAGTLNAAVGASRAAVDSEYASHDMQVGQTGKVVNPKLYIACGISGAIQHLVGMKTAKTIVAINTDSEAPIFKKADYGIVGDLFEIIPLLNEKIKNI